MPNRPAHVSPKGIVRMLMAALLTEAPNSKAAQLPSAEGEPERYSHTMTLHSNERNNGNAILWMNLTSIALSERKQKLKDYNLYDYCIYIEQKWGRLRRAGRSCESGDPKEEVRGGHLGRWKCCVFSAGKWLFRGRRLIKLHIYMCIFHYKKKIFLKDPSFPPS